MFLPVKEQNKILNHKHDPFVLLLLDYIDNIH